MTRHRPDDRFLFQDLRVQHSHNFCAIVNERGARRRAGQKARARTILASPTPRMRIHLRAAVLLVAVVVVVEGRAAGLVTGEDIGASGGLVRYHEGHDKMESISDERHVVEGAGDSTGAPAAAIAHLYALVVPGVAGDARHLRLLYEALEAREVAIRRHVLNNDGRGTVHGGTDGVQSGHAGAVDEEADIVWTFEPGDPRLLPRARGGGGGGGGHVDSPSPSTTLSIPAEETDTSSSGLGRRRRRTRAVNHMPGRASYSFPFQLNISRHESRLWFVCVKPLKYPIDTKDARRY